MINECKGVLFDFNGTLFFDSDKHVLAWGKLSEDLRGVGISSEELQTHFYGVPNNRAIEYLIQRSCLKYNAFIIRKCEFPQLSDKFCTKCFCLLPCDGTRKHKLCHSSLWQHHPFVHSTRLEH